MDETIKSTVAKTLRRNQTDAERILCQHLRSRQLNGLKFRRQQPIGNYFVDFVCLEKKLIIELDGELHLFHAKEDIKRTAWLESEGYKVIRFWNDQIISDVEAVKLLIKRKLSES